MFKAKMAIVALALAVPVLGGCHSIFGGGLTIRARGDAIRPGTEASYAAAQLEAGRKALDDGQVSAAIAAFRNAKLYPDQAAAASNGLAIAYSQLGRPDLAQRYFQQAVAMEPTEPRYQANLQRFYQLNPVELTINAGDQPAPAATTAPASQTRMVLVSQTGVPTAVTVSRPQQRLVRLSAGEVRVGSDKPGPVHSPVTVERAGAYPVRVSFAPREVFVGKPRPAAVAVRPRAAVAIAQEYPLRVDLKSR